MKVPLKLLGLIPLAALIAVALAVESPGAGVAPTGVCAHEFSAGITGHPIGLAKGPDGNLWFTEQLEDKVGVFNPRTGRAREFPVPAGTAPHSIAAGPDGNLWFTGINGTVGKVAPATGKATIVVTKAIPPGSIPQDLIAAPDGNLYVSLQEAGFVAKLDPRTGAFALIPPVGLPPVSRPHGLTLDPDGRHLWVALQNGDALARYDYRTGRYDKLVRFSESSGPSEVRYGPGRRLFTTLQYEGSIGEYDVDTGKVSEFASSLPPPVNSPDFAPGPKLIDVIPDPHGGAVWVSTSVVSQLYRFDVASKRLTRLSCGITKKSGTQSLVLGPDGKLWFTEPLGGRIARVDE